MDKKGFTLVELLAVIALVSVLSGLAVSNVISSVKNSKKNEFLMDAKSIPVFKIMLSIGITGCFLVIICFIIVSNAPCNIIENITKIDNKYLYKDTDKEIDFVRQVCGLIDYDDITNKMKLYYDHFVIYFKDYSNSNRLILEIFIIPLYIFIYVSINLTQAMILKYLDSNAMLVNINFNYLFSRLISYPL